ncbi:MAG: R2-like ligand-binding oxidase [Actinomycetota bacterium]
MTDAAPSNGQEGHTYTSPRGLDYESVPMRLWNKSKQLFWDPADIDFAQDGADWKAMTGEQQLMLAMSCRGFMVGEEAVTLDILPLLRAMSDMGRLEDTMYLSMFAMEEAKHVDFFRRWFNAVEFDPSLGGDGYGGGYGGNGETPQIDPFAALQRIMGRLDNDRSPKRILDATLLYNHLIEAVFAIAGYRRFDQQFKVIGQEKLPALREGLKLIQRDERRHIAYGTYLSRRIIAENPEIWEWVEQRWERMAGPLMNGAGDEITRTLAKRRLDVLRVAKDESVDQVEHTEIAEFEPDEMLETAS